jgi:hypothetical protein
MMLYLWTRLRVSFNAYIYIYIYIYIDSCCYISDLPGVNLATNEQDDTLLLFNDQSALV